MAVFKPIKVTALPGVPNPDSVYFEKGVADSRVKMYVTDTSGTAYPVGIISENDVLNTLLAGYSVGTNTPIDSSNSILQAFQRVQGQINSLSTAVSQGMKTPLPIDCSTNPDYPAAEAGDTYKVTVAGRIGGASGPIVQPNDVIIALADNAGGTEAAVGSQWTVVQANVDNATEAVVGLTRIATQVEVNAGSEAFAYVTPLTLGVKLGGFVPSSRTLTINDQTFNLNADRAFTVGYMKGAQRDDVNTQINQGNPIAYLDRFISSATNSDVITGTTPPNNSNGLFTLTSANNGFGKQLSWVDDDDLYIRKVSANNFGPFRKLLHTGNFVSGVNYQPVGNYALQSINIGTNNGITGGGNLSADRTLSLTGLALAFHNLGSNGFAVRTAAGTVAARSLASAAGTIGITNGDGVAGNPNLEMRWGATDW